MEKRASVRAYYDNKANKVIEDKKYASRTAQLDALELTIIKAFNNLLRYMDGKTTKTEITNQLREIATPDILKLLPMLDKLDKSIIGAKVDQKPLLDALNSLKREVTLVPAKMPKPFVQKESIKVSNLKEIVFDTSELEKLVKGLKLQVDAPIINVEKTDIKPLQDLMLKLLTAYNKQKQGILEGGTVKVSNLDEIKPTDTKEIEKKLDQSNKHLKEIAEKKFGGGGGGGGNGSPYTDSNGITKNVILESGRVPMSLAGEGIATEATLAKLNEFAIPVFDTQVIDESLSPATTTITYKLAGATVATKTITVSGTTTTISVA